MLCGKERDWANIDGKNDRQLRRRSSTVQKQPPPKNLRCFRQGDAVPIIDLSWDRWRRSLYLHARVPENRLWGWEVDGAGGYTLPTILVETNRGGSIIARMFA